MATDPTGVCFVSYRRVRGQEAALVIAALRDRGVPTWQDISDLPTTQTEDEIRRVLRDPATACAVLYATPEVEFSDVIRNVEVPGIMSRHMEEDGFFAMPVAAGGLAYGDVARVLGPQVRLANLSGWNIHKVDADPLDAAGAKAIGNVVLRQRLQAIHKSLPPGQPLKVAVTTRAPLPKGVGNALSLDLTHRFDGRFAIGGSWSNHLLPAFASMVREVSLHAPGRPVEVSGLLAIPAAVAMGTAFLSVGGSQVSWMQEQRSHGRPIERWGLDVPRQASGFVARKYASGAGGTDLALLVSVAAAVEDDFALMQPGMPSLRAVVSVSPPRSGIVGDRITLGAAQALDVAHLAVDALRAARLEYRCRGTVHLFLAVPVGLGFLVGQLLNTFGAVQTYEHQPGDSIPYRAAALLAPSN